MLKASYGFSSMAAWSEGAPAPAAILQLMAEKFSILCSPERRLKKGKELFLIFC